MIKGDTYAYVHIPRTGGALLERLFEVVSPSCVLYDELGVFRHDHVSSVVKNNEFVFSTLRDPFEYYLSIWRFDSKRVWSLAHPLIFQRDEHYEFPAFVARLFAMKGKTGKAIYDFKTMHEKDIGILTYRFLYQCCDFDVFNEPHLEENWKDHLLVGHIVWIENYRRNLEHLFVKHKKYFDFDTDNALLKFDSLGRVNETPKDRPAKEYLKENPQTAEQIAYKERIIYQLMEDYDG